MNCYNTSCQSYQKWAIGNDIRAILIADSGINQMVGTKIFPLIAPENVDGDFIIYQRDKYSKSATKMGIYEDACDIFITAVSDNYDNAIALASDIDNALVGTHTLNGGIKIRIDLADSTESFSDDKYIETMLFTIK